ncbi:hypothetical protein [Paenibacillus thiaminolyticus]|uniref:hypothetical protein n=1 Tax=Paenibacillus thiaminolyticus TaxID=49283 RepID=UPI0011C3781C|nr:hypothetical protein [Paenibacillus thiaminolyticus]
MFFSYCFELSPILYNRERNRNAYSLQLITIYTPYTISRPGKPPFAEFARSPMPQSSSRGCIASLLCGFIIYLHEMQEPFTKEGTSVQPRAAGAHDPVAGRVPSYLCVDERVESD